MRIGVDASRAFVGEKTGTEVYSYSLLRSLMHLPEAEKHSWVLYLKPSPSVQLDHFAKFENVKLVQIKLPRFWTQLGLAYRTWVDKLDVLWIPAHTLPILRRPGLKTVVTIHGVEYEFLPRFYGEWARLHLTWSTEYAIKAATKVFAVSEFTKKSLVEHLGADPNKIEVVHEGVSLKRHFLAASQGSAFKKFGLMPKGYILFVGTIQPRKNLARLIEAFSQINQSPINKSLKLVIAGKLGWKYDEILEAPKKYGIEDRVVFTGYVREDERIVLLRYALIYVQPSLTEGFGLPVLEAMAAGVPVVCADTGALPEIAGDAALLFDPTSVGRIIKSLRQVIGSGGTMATLVSKGKLRARQFSWEEAAIKTLKVLEVAVQQ